MSLFYSNPQGGRGGQFLLFDSVRVHCCCDSQEFVYILADFLPQFSTAFPRSRIGGFFVLFLASFDFFSAIKRVTISDRNNIHYCNSH